MKAILFRRPAPENISESFFECDKPDPIPGPHDLLVAVRAVAINQGDLKIRDGSIPLPLEVDALGWDTSGVVVSVGARVSLFKPGDEVFYAGTFPRTGASAELHLVDEHVVGIKPKSCSFAEAASLPMASLTAWELLFQRLAIPLGEPVDSGSILITGAAGGIGSMVIQLARQLTGLTVIATASREESKAWCYAMGAHHVIDHTLPLESQVAILNVAPVSYVACLSHTDAHIEAITRIIQPFGAIAIADDTQNVNTAIFKPKSLSVHWEMVFTSSLFDPSKLISHHHILNEISSLADIGILRPTLTHSITPLSAANLAKAHLLLESGKTHGKIVISNE